MNNNVKHPIIANGQYYIEPLIKKVGGQPPTYPHDYDEAKGRLCLDVEKIQESIKDNKEIFLEDKVICIRLESKYEAKSYMPTSIVADSNMKLIGGRKYTIDTNTDSKGKMYFVRTNDQELIELKQKLECGKKDHVKKWKDQVCIIKSIDLLKPEEKIMGFPDGWEKGTVEVVLHPLGIHEHDSIVQRTEKLNCGTLQEKLKEHILTGGESQR